MLSVMGPIRGWTITGIFVEARWIRVECARHNPKAAPHEAQFVVVEEDGEDFQEALARLAGKAEQYDKEHP